MSNDATEPYLHNRIVDGLLSAADAAVGMGAGNRRESDAALHARFIVGIRTAENAARGIAHSRGLHGQGIAWVRLAGKLHTMLDSSTKSVALSAANSIDTGPKMGRGPLWVRLGEALKFMAEDCNKATQRKSTEALIIGGHEYMN
jgi:hypothetical protein